MNKQQVIWLATAVIFVAPSLLYFVVNGYWWLFDGNRLDQDKMFAAGLISFTGSYSLVVWACIEEVWEKP